MWGHVCRGDVGTCGSWGRGTWDVAGCLLSPRGGERRSLFAGCPRERCWAVGRVGYLSVIFRSKG